MQLTFQKTKLISSFHFTEYLPPPLKLCHRNRSPLAFYSRKNGQAHFPCHLISNTQVKNFIGCSTSLSKFSLLRNNGNILPLILLSGFTVFHSKRHAFFWIRWPWLRLLGLLLFGSQESFGVKSTKDNGLTKKSESLQKS